jgi:hypothetical protein
MRADESSEEGELHVMSVAEWKVEATGVPVSPNRQDGGVFLEKGGEPATADINTAVPPATDPERGETADTGVSVAYVKVKGWGEGEDPAELDTDTSTSPAAEAGVGQEMSVERWSVAGTTTSPPGSANTHEGEGKAPKSEPLSCRSVPPRVDPNLGEMLDREGGV